MRRSALLTTTTTALGAMLMGAVLLGACGRRTAYESPIFEELRTNAGARRGVAIVTDDNETNREAAEALAGSLAGECSAEALGVKGSMDECLAAARERGVEGLVTCRVIEYDPYDPQRLVVSLTLARPGGALRMSAQEVMALGRDVGRSPGFSTTHHESSTTVKIGLSGDWYVLYAKHIGLGTSPEDLLEAEILLRDPKRFFPFAAREIAARLSSPKSAKLARRGELPAGETVPAPRPTETARAPAPAPDSHTLGALRGLR